MLCLFSFVSVIFFSCSALSASFNCKKASTDIEKIICNSKELSKADELLAQSFKKARNKVTNADNLKKLARANLEYRQNKCGKDESCLKQWYSDSISFYDQIAKGGDIYVYIPRDWEDYLENEYKIDRTDEDELISSMFESAPVVNQKTPAELFQREFNVAKDEANYKLNYLKIHCDGQINSSRNRISTLYDSISRTKNAGQAKSYHLSIEAEQRKIDSIKQRCKMQADEIQKMFNQRVKQIQQKYSN